jgi:hypothetical protein
MNCTLQLFPHTHSLAEMQNARSRIGGRILRMGGLKLDTTGSEAAQPGDPSSVLFTAQQTSQNLRQEVLGQIVGSSGYLNHSLDSQLLSSPRPSASTVSLWTRSSHLEVGNCLTLFSWQVIVKMRCQSWLWN